MSNNFKVIKIVSDSEIVVNAGTEKGIHKGAELQVFIPGEEVIDPETGDSLGALDFIKAYLYVKHAFPKMCVCENSETITSNPFALMESYTTHQTKRLNVDSTEISGGLSGSRKIKIGDLVRKS